MTKNVIEYVNSENIKEAEDFLIRFEESSLFLISNLKEHGLKMSDHLNSGQFKMIKNNGKVCSVFCLSNRGNLYIQSTINNPSLMLSECEKEPIQIKSFIGDWDSVEPVYRLYKERNILYIPKFESKEILYSYKLIESDLNIRHDENVRLLNISDFPQWLELNNSYMEELSLPNVMAVEKIKNVFENQILNKVWWGLFDNDRLVSRAALSVKIDKISQVGGVFTLKEYRKKGLAKLVMSHLLKDCRDLHGHNKNILFTGETDIPAQKLYESIGYQRIGSFALILG